MASISHLGNLQPSEPIDLSTYTGEKASGTSSFRMPTPGRYTVRAPESFPDTAFSASKAGALLAQIDPTIVGGEHDGFQIRFVKVSAKTWDRTRKVAGVETKETASQLANYLKACGRTGAMPTEPQDQANAVEQTAGQLYEVETDWKIWDSASQQEFTLSKNPDVFARGENGEILPYMVVRDNDGQVVLDENGREKRLRANLTISRFIAAN